jgi:hypothetical protein
MPKKTLKAQRLVTYVPADVMLQCKSDAAALSMTLSEYVALVLRARGGKWTLPPPTVPTALAARSHGTVPSSPVFGGTSAGAATGASKREYNPRDPFGAFDD